MPSGLRSACVVSGCANDGRFLVAYDMFLAELDAAESMVVTHMGHTGDRARGDSRLRDWPDVEWRLVRQDDDPRSPRFISAYGRDVDVQEQRLDYEAQTRRLTLVGGNRKDARTTDALEAVRGLLAGAEDALSGRQIKDEMSGSGYGKDAIDAALALGRKNNKLTFSPGPRGAKLYSLPASDRPRVSDIKNPDSVSSVSRPYRGRTLGHSQEGTQERSV